MKYLLLSFFLTLPALADEVKTVPAVEFSRYAGTWHEVARLPTPFQDSIVKDGTGFSACTQVTATYGSLPKGLISVENRCVRTRGEESKEIVARAKASVVKGSNGAKLKVNFSGSEFLRRLGVANGDYWVMELGPVGKDGLYSYSLVGTPSREYAWILARETSLPAPTLAELVAELKAQGFDTDRLIYAR